MIPPIHILQSISIMPSGCKDKRRNPRCSPCLQFRSHQIPLHTNNHQQITYFPHPVRSVLGLKAMSVIQQLQCMSVRRTNNSTSNNHYLVKLDMRFQVRLRGPRSHHILVHTSSHKHQIIYLRYPVKSIPGLEGMSISQQPLCMLVMRSQVRS